MQGMWIPMEWAERYGVEEAAFLSQLVFWIETNKANEVNFYDGRTWCYNSKVAWAKLLPCWTEKQLRRIIDSLVQYEVVLKGTYNTNPYDRTTWYAIVDEVLYADSGTRLDQMGQSILDQSDQSILDQMGQPIPVNNSEDKAVNERYCFASQIREVVDHLNKVTKSNYSAKTKATERVIKARLKEGRTVEELCKVIDYKAGEWLSDPKMSEFLRPETLFGGKCESYLQAAMRTGVVANRGVSGGEDEKSGQGGGFLTQPEWETLKIDQIERRVYEAITQVGGRETLSQLTFPETNDEEYWRLAWKIIKQQQKTGVEKIISQARDHAETAGQEY